MNTYTHKYLWHMPHKYMETQNRTDSSQKTCHNKLSVRFHHGQIYVKQLQQNQGLQ